MKAFIMESGNKNSKLLQQSLIRVSAGLSSLSGSLPDGEREKCRGVVSTLERSVIPQLSADSPLLVAVTGGGSSGKSTVFNALAGARVSASDPRAGYTRRMVAAIHPKVAADKRKMELLFERFRANARPRILGNPNEPLDPGDPVYVECPNVPEHLVLVDTPDFDTGTREGFTNQAAAKEILDVADVILYIATNATYNNKTATDFVRKVLSEVGLRKIALLYRLLPFYGDDVVQKHMDAVLDNLDLDDRMKRDACIGIWRMDESNDVAAGLREPDIRPIADGIPLVQALAALDPTKTRANVMRTEIADAFAYADEWARKSAIESLKFAAYRDSLKFLTSKVCTQCLEVAPQRDILRLFAEEWERAQPWMVRNGHWLSRSVRKGSGWMADKVLRRTQTEDKGPAFLDEFRKMFVRYARELQNHVEPPGTHVDFPKDSADMQPLVEALGTLARTLPKEYSLMDMAPRRKNGFFAATVARPALPSRSAAKGLSAGDALARVTGQAAAVMGETESLRPEVRRLVQEFRENMTAWQSAREWFSASLDTVALLGTLTYVVVTGDAFTGGALISMFGVNDIVVIPALAATIAASSHLDKKTVERHLSKLFTSWAREKAGAIRSILEDGISGSDITACDAECKRLDSTLSGLKSDLDAARAQAAIVFGTPS